MKIEPVIRSRFTSFRSSRDLEAMDEGEAFERFVCHTLVSAHQPDAFGSHDDRLETICVGGGADMGIDGIAILLNDLIVTSPDDIEDILDVHRRAQVEFIFIQSKLSPRFDLGDFSKFASGVREFLGSDQLPPRNEKIELALKLKEHLLSDEVVIRWESNPTVRLYYVAMGTWKDAQPHVAQAERTKRDIAALNTYGDCKVHFYDAAALKTACDNSENRFSAVIEAVESMPLTAVEGVDNSCIALCYAPAYLSLLTNEDGMIRKALFDDNVRDFQGDNSVNLEISKTIETEPRKFGLLNNGITVVCDEFTHSNRRITVRNPQVVNGCQTS
ncbi:MAG: hypothetical protein HW385_1600, partial [candidate division NC10 bacterium]|nr:hypothetical protein [candidate division NC10 bacterium]